MKKYFLLFTIAGLFYSTLVTAKPDDIYIKYQQQADTIYQQMSLDEKLGQLLMPSYAFLANAVSENGSLCKSDINNPKIAKQTLLHDCGLDQIQQYHFGAVLTGGGPYFNAPTLENWAALNKLSDEQHALGSPHDPLLLTGNDAIHGNMHLQGAVIFPHNIGLGVTHDANLVYQIGLLVGQDSLASGFNWVYMPTIAVAQDIRWGRTYESFGQDPLLAKSMAKAYISGFQHVVNNRLTGPLATAKHFIGDGATQYGLDEGDDAYQGTEKDFWKMNGQGYEGALQADVGSIMVSYNAINGDKQRMHFGGNWDIINQFKHEGIIGTDNQNYRFAGFMVSDWNGPTRAAYFYTQATGTPLTLLQILAKSINSGVDMIMIGQADTTNPFDANAPVIFKNIGQVFDALKTAYQQHLISDTRLKEAVTRIIRVKLAMSPAFHGQYASLQAEERALALRAAEKSLVLLKNEKTIPVNKKQIRNVVLIGNTDDLGIQNGGWTVNWQGQKGNQYFTGNDKISSGAVTLEEGVKNTFKKQAVNFYHDGQFPPNLKANDTIAIALLAEVPYAEFMGDIGNPYKADEWYNMGAANQYNLYYTLPQSQDLSLTFNAEQTKAIQALKQRGIKVITVVYSGRPVILTAGKEAAPLTNSDALIAAFLPGTLGGTAVANAIFGDYHFRSQGENNTLTFPWPRNMEDINVHFKKGSLFPVGFGLR